MSYKFPQGTTHITTGDKIHDERRSKSKCKYFSKGHCLFSGKRAKREYVRYDENGVVCSGSAHCLRYVKKDN